MRSEGAAAGRAAVAGIPVIAVSIMFYGVYVIFTIGISVQRKTWFAVIFTTLSALVNVGLNLILIRPYGSMGAALSTLLAYMVLAGVTYVVNQRIYPIVFQLRGFVAALLMLLSLAFSSAFAQGKGIAPDLMQNLVGPGPVTPRPRR